MAFSQHKRAVGVFSSRRDAEHALHELRNSGFSMDKVSVVARDADRNDDIAGADVSTSIGNKADEGAATGAVTGATLGGITGLLVGLGSLAIPGVGPVILAGEVATTIATTLAGAGIGAATGGLLGALVGLGIPEERARAYNERVSRGEYLVIVNGSDAEVASAERILTDRGIQDWGIYDAPGTSAVGTDYALMSTGAAAGMPIADPMGIAPIPTTYATTDADFSRQKRAVGIFSNRNDAELALQELRNSGFGMDRVSVIAKDAGRNDRIAGTDVSDRLGTTGNKADEGAAAGALTGGALGGLGGLLVGLGTLAIPGVGPVLAGGAVATALSTALAGGAIGAAAGGLTGALVGLGIPEERARFYNDRVERGNYLVFVDGTDNEIARAEAVLSRRGIQDWGIYDASGTGNAPADYNYANLDTLSVVDSTRSDANVASPHPNVTIVDRRNETL